MTKSETLEFLQRAGLQSKYSTKGCFPVFIPSVFRPAHYTYRNIIKNLPDEIKRLVTYVTRSEQLEEYQEAQPDVRVIAVHPKYEYSGYGLDTTRKFIWDYARCRGYDFIFDIDDDIDRLTFAYQSEQTTRRFGVMESKLYMGDIFATLSEMTRVLCAYDSDLALGSLPRITPTSAEHEFSNVAAYINGMSVPRTFNIVNLKTCYEKGIRHGKKYDKHCEDLGMLERVLKRGGKVFKIPCGLYTTPSVKDANTRTETLVHNQDSTELYTEATKLLEAGYLAPYLSYLSRDTSDTGNLKRPTAINWRKYHKAHGTFTEVINWDKLEELYEHTQT